MPTSAFFISKRRRRPAKLRRSGEMVSRIGPRAVIRRRNSTSPVFYGTGQVVPQDYAEAVKWYLAAAKQELAEAQCNLGLCYQTGRGVPQNTAVAVKWLIKAARRGTKPRSTTSACIMPRWKRRRPPLLKLKKTRRADTSARQFRQLRQLSIRLAGINGFARQIPPCRERSGFPGNEQGRAGIEQNRVALRIRVPRRAKCGGQYPRSRICRRRANPPASPVAAGNFGAIKPTC